MCHNKGDLLIPLIPTIADNRRNLNITLKNKMRHDIVNIGHIYIFFCFLYKTDLKEFR